VEFTRSTTDLRVAKWYEETMGVTTRFDRVVLHSPAREKLRYAEAEVAGCGVMNYRRHSQLTAAAVLVLLLSVLLLLLHLTHPGPTHRGNAPALLALTTWFLFGIVYVAVSLLHENKAQQLPRSAFRSALFDRPPPSFPSSFSATFVA
jgi:hypothetical protein